MKSITSISGGKSSSMMAVEYPTDFYVFAVVLTEDKNAIPKDKGLLRECQKRIPHFEASRELDLTLKNILNLEQLLGKPIDWVAAEFTFDQLISQSIDQPGLRSGNLFLPNKTHRLCTQYLKIEPIFQYWFKNLAPDPVMMNIGFRWDEPERVKNWSCKNERQKYAYACSLSDSKQYKWKSVDWRVADFPLYNNRKIKQNAADFWNKKGWKFPAVSNCDFCFNHKKVQQQIQYKDEPKRANWWMDWEAKTDRSFGDAPLSTIFQQNLLDVFDTDDSGVSCVCSD